MLKIREIGLGTTILGKRIDYSGRSVIVLGPDLSINECTNTKVNGSWIVQPFIHSKLMLGHGIRGQGNTRYLLDCDR